MGIVKGSPKKEPKRCSVPCNKKISLRGTTKILQPKRHLRMIISALGLGTLHEVSTRVPIEDRFQVTFYC